MHPLSRHRWSCSFAGLVLLCIGLAAADMPVAGAAQQEGPVLRRKQPFHPIILESGKRVSSYTSGKDRVFVASPGQIRQGSVKLWAPRMVVWFDMEASEATETARITVYAEGSGRPGKRPKEAVRLVEGTRSRSLGAVLVQMRSKVGFTRRAATIKSPDAAKKPFVKRASSLRSGTEGGLASPTIPSGPTPAPPPGVPVSLTSESQYSFTESKNRRAMVFLGDVRVNYKKVRVRADSAVLWMNRSENTFQVYARGDVRVSKQRNGQETEESGRTLQFTRRFKHLNADELYINPEADRGLAKDAEVRVGAGQKRAADTYVVDGKKVYMLDSRSLMVREGRLSTCSFAEPHYQLWADRYTITQGKNNAFLSMWEAGAQVGDWKSPALPFLATDLTGEPLFRLDFGSRNRFGSYLRTTWAPGRLGYTAPWLDKWTVNLDYYSDRGPAAGTRMKYDTAGAGPDHSGRFKGYYVNDSADEDVTGRRVRRNNRGQVWLQHRTQWASNWRTDLEYHWLSDRGFRNEYFEDEFETSKRPESFLMTRYRENSTWAALTLQPQVNDFQTQLERMPAAELAWLGLPFSGFVYDGSFEGGRFDLERDEALPGVDPPDVARFHTAHRVSYPFSLSFLRFDPYLEGLGTFADEGARRGGSFTDSQSRVGSAAGIYTSTTLARTYSARSQLLDMTRLRHVIIPYTSARTQSVSGDTSRDFIQMDEVDALDDTDRVTAGLQQTVQTKRGEPGSWRTAELLSLDTGVVSQSSDSVVPALERDFVEVDMTARPTSYVNIHSRDNEISLDDERDVYNVGVGADVLPSTRVAVDYDRIEDVTSTLSTRLYYRLSDRWRLYFAQKYDLDSRGAGESKELETELHFARRLHCWRLDLGLELDEVNNETEVIFGLSPIGWGESLMQDLDFDRDYYEQ